MNLNNYNNWLRLCLCLCTALSTLICVNCSPASTSERHDTQCHISTNDLLATAQATATRVLHGVCSAHELEQRFWSLENSVTDRISQLSSQLNQLLSKMDQKETDDEYRHRKTMHSLKIIRSSQYMSGATSASSGGVESSGKDDTDDQDNSDEDDGDDGDLQTSASRTRYQYLVQPTTTTAASDGKTPHQHHHHSRVRTSLNEWLRENPVSDDISSNNNTLHTEHGRRVFTYYWRVPDMSHKMRYWAVKRSIRSPSFYIFSGGYRLYLKMFPRQNGKNVYIHVGITSGDYDDLLDWPFTINLRAQVIDQNQPTVRQDISSRIWKPQELCSSWNWRKPAPGSDNYECVGLGFPHEVIQSYNYLWKDSLLVKLTAYLDSE